ncbi:helix-turn-helix domain-containing protein [Rhodococcus koreensis]
MRELIVQLSTVGGGAVEALRVIDHFDTLVDQRASALAMLRAAATLADCAVGLEDPERGLRVGVDSKGRTVADPDDRKLSLQIAHFEEIKVWLDRDGCPWPLDRLILERFSRSLQAVKKARDISPTVAATRTVCDADAAPADRETALRRLGLGGAVSVVATHVSDARKLPPGLVLDESQINLLPPAAVGEMLASDVAAGIHTCSGSDVHRQWPLACTALRIAVDLATGAPTHVSYEELGSIATIVDNVAPEAAAGAPDVRRIVELQSKRPWVVRTLESVVSHSSIREAARLQNLHHSTLRQRIDWLEQQLGYALLSGDGYARASTTLTLWRIAMAAERPGTSGGTGRASLPASAS